MKKNMKYLKLIFFINALVLFIKGVEQYSFSLRQKLPYQKTYQFMDSTMSYEVIGKGESIILLHGSMYSNCWKGFEDRLAETYQVYLPHMPGFGASDAVKGELHNTDLFSEAFCSFLKETELESAPVMSASLGTLVSVKSAVKGCSQGKLILGAMPGEISGWKAQLIQGLPLAFRHLLVATNWGKEKILIPALRENIGQEKKDNQRFLNDLKSTDARSIVDIDYKEEVEVKLFEFFPLVKNEIVFIYGEFDSQKETTKELTKGEYIVIPKAEHNFALSQPEKSLEVLLEVLEN